MFRLTSRTRTIGYYAGLMFGIGYCLTFLGEILAFAQMVLMAMMLEYAWEVEEHVYSETPMWHIGYWAFLVLGMICAIYLGVTIIRNSKSARNYGLKLDTISSSVYAFTFMLIFSGIGILILAADTGFSMFSLCGLIGPILLLMGFHSYRSEVAKTKIMGAIMMFASVALIYFVPYRLPLIWFFGLYSPHIVFGLFPIAGPLLSESTLEAIALLIAIICAAIVAIPILGEKRKQSAAGIILSISGILFSTGVIDCTISIFWAKPASLVVMALWAPIMFFGLLMLVVSGIIAWITSCLLIAISAKQLFTKPEATPNP